MDKLLVMGKKVGHELILHVCSSSWGKEYARLIELGIHIDVGTNRFSCAFGAKRESCLFHEPGRLQLCSPCPASLWTQSVETGIDVFSCSECSVSSKKKYPTTKQKWEKNPAWSSAFGFIGTVTRGYCLATVVNGSTHRKGILVQISQLTSFSLYFTVICLS